MILSMNSLINLTVNRPDIFYVINTYDIVTIHMIEYGIRNKLFNLYNTNTNTRGDIINKLVRSLL